MAAMPWLSFLHRVSFSCVYFCVLLACLNDVSFSISRAQQLQSCVGSGSSYPWSPLQGFKGGNVLVMARPRIPDNLDDVEDDEEDEEWKEWGTPKAKPTPEPEEVSGGGGMNVRLAVSRGRQHQRPTLFWRSNCKLRFKCKELRGIMPGTP